MNYGMSERMIIMLILRQSQSQYMTQALLGLDYLRLLLLLDLLQMEKIMDLLKVGGMIPQKAILLLMELKLIGKHVVIVHSTAVR